MEENGQRTLGLVVWARDLVDSRFHDLLISGGDIGFRVTLSLIG